MPETVCIPDWKKEFEVGIPEIDYQHKYFLMLIRRFYRLVQDDIIDSLQRNVLQELAYYARFHFCSEENLMKMAGYPFLEQHIEEHIALIDEVANRINLFRVKKASASEITKFLLRWFIDHTLEDDLQFAEFYRKSEPLDYLLEVGV